MLEPTHDIQVGETPISGVRLERVLRGNPTSIKRIGWSANGKVLASLDLAGTLLLWNLDTGSQPERIGFNTSKLTDFSWSPNAYRLALSTDRSILVYEISKRQVLWENEIDVTGVSWSPRGDLIVTGTPDGEDDALRLWNASSGDLVHELRDHNELVDEFAWSPDGIFLASGGVSGNDVKEDDPYESAIRIWNVDARRLEYRLAGHTSFIADLAWSPKSAVLASVSADATVRAWDPTSGIPISVIEAHTDGTRGLSFSPDGRILVTSSWDRTVRLWKSGTWDLIAVLQVAMDPKYLVTTRAAWDSVGRKLATVTGREILLWDVDIDVLLNTKSAPESVRYTTAKVVLVGDSGVGKTGLGWRLAHGSFKEHASTHGQQFWIINDLSTKRSDGTECEAVLWDLAGQHIYRPIHAIFLNDVDLSLIVFDPSNRQEPLKGVEFWLEQLAGKDKLPPSVLVGARVDRGSSVLSQEDLLRFCQRHGISGGYVSTSAKASEGLEQLLGVIKEQIPWEQMTATVTTVTFKRVKDYVLALKEQPQRKSVLVQPEELRRQLQSTDPQWQFTSDQMMTAVKHLGNHGYVTILRTASGEQVILLVPELLVEIASSIVLHADKHPRELGAINESDLLQGLYTFPELAGLERREQEILLDAAIVRFLEHNVCFREALGSNSLFIFPGLIKQKRPLVDAAETVEDVSYIVRGRVENVYPALVVLLGYTQAFTRINQWQNQAQYEMGRDQICGFRMIEEHEGELELVLYYSPMMPDYGRAMFQGLFEKFLYQRNVEVTRFPLVACPNGHQQARATVIKRLREGKTFLHCDECGAKMILPELEQPQALGAREAQWIQREEALARLRSTYEMNLANVRSFRRDREAPRCYLSYIEGQSDLVAQLARDLSDAGVLVISDVEQIQEKDAIILMCTPSYKQAWNNASKDVSADAALIRARLQQTTPWPTVIPLIVEGDPATACPRELSHHITGDFRDETKYVSHLFDLVLTLYAIPFQHHAFAPLRRSLELQWKKTVVELIEDGHTGTVQPTAETKEVVEESSHMIYHDFQLQVTAASKICASSKQGDANAEFHLQMGNIKLALSIIENGRISGELLKNLGRELYEALFPATIHGLLQATIAAAQGVGASVRLRLLIDSPELAALPWEFLYDESTNRFLANDISTALSRYVDVPLQKRELRSASGPLKILLVISSPTDLEPLDSAEEEQLIREALAQHLDTGRVELDVVHEATIRNINGKLRAKPYNVFHFIGHGIFENDRGHIALVAPNGKAKLLNDEDFANFFLGNRTLGIAVLNACEGAVISSHTVFRGIAPNLVRRGIPAVVAMQYSILDETAKLFADEFYRTLAIGYPVDAAIQTTRNAISMEVGLDKPDFGTPVLYMRAEDGAILTGL